MAKIEFKKIKFDDALKCLEESIEIKKKISGFDSFDERNILFFLAQI